MLLGFLFCKETLARLDDYVDRELSPHEMRQVATHLKICAKCARLYHFERGFIEDMRAKVSEVQAPPELMGRVRLALRAADESARG